ncbi:two-component system sensor histidine kinase NtrB [Psychrobacter aestuarii]|uniref:histidine kinase n=2 Tax=Psychrobacter aestuarii TaxID=556327 RepID=A0ABP3FML5_9GAMM|nr:ATP-binding protein [Psychrobacter aestuarii]
MSTSATHPHNQVSLPDLAFVAQHLFTAVLWVDAHLKIIWINTQAEQLLAISRGRLLQQSILTLLTARLPYDKSALIVPTNDSAQLLAERFAQASQYQQPFIDHDHVIEINSTTVVSIDYSVTPVRHQDSDAFIIEMWGKDRQSRIAGAQQKQQQYDVARHMLRAVAHEVKNPLAGIRGAAQLLARQYQKFSQSGDTQSSPLPQKLLGYTDIIISETDRLTQLIGQMLGSSRLPDWQPLNIHEPLEHVLTLSTGQYPSVTVHRDYDLSLPELIADKDQLIQVFLNLINNACEAMSEYQARLDDKSRYQMHLNVQTRVVFQHTIGNQQHRQVLQVSVIDNGAGIPPELVGQIFFPMVTSRAQGTGLGLSIVQDIISRHHGMIEVDSMAGRTCFMVYLPFIQPSKQPDSSSTR